MSCDKGISLLCIVNSPIFDAVAAAWQEFFRYFECWSVYVLNY